ncbi:MAG: tetratricopeptide repeat protein [Desulfobacterales bacterium]|nr:tetratricopeptide repeat protein [Desulfobacterales bacterium]
MLSLVAPPFLGSLYAKAPALSPKALSYKEEGNRFFESGAFMKAIKAYTKAIKADPKYFEARYNRGIAWQKIALYYKAIVDFDKALEIRPGDTDTLYFRGRSFEATGQLKKALSDIQKAARKRHHRAKKYLTESKLKARILAQESKKKESAISVSNNLKKSPQRPTRIVNIKNRFGGKTTSTLFSKGDPLYEGEDGICKQINFYDASSTLIRSETFHHALFNAKNSRNKTITHLNNSGIATLVEHHLTGSKLGKVDLFYYTSDGKISRKETVTLSQYQEQFKGKG